MSRLLLALALLKQSARPDELAGMARFGINPERRLGLSMPAMRGAAKTLGQDHELALAGSYNSGFVSLVSTIR